MKEVYKTTVSATGGRNGLIKSEDGVLEFEVRIPKEMGGAGGRFSNPEQLFAAGYAACFDSALNFVALQEKIRLKDTKVTATVGLLSSELGGFNLTVTLDVNIPGIERTVAQGLLEKAHATCPYSKAISNNVEASVNLV